MLYYHILLVRNHYMDYHRRLEEIEPCQSILNRWWMLYHLCLVNSITLLANAYTLLDLFRIIGCRQRHVTSTRTILSSQACSRWSDIALLHLVSLPSMCYQETGLAYTYYDYHYRQYLSVRHCISIHKQSKYAIQQALVVNYHMRDIWMCSRCHFLLFNVRRQLLSWLKPIRIVANHSST